MMSPEGAIGPELTKWGPLGDKKAGLIRLIRVDSSPDESSKGAAFSCNDFAIEIKRQLEDTGVICGWRAMPQAGQEERARKIPN